MNIVINNKKYLPDPHTFEDKSLDFYWINDVPYITRMQFGRCVGMMKPKLGITEFYEKHKKELKGLVIEVKQTTEDKTSPYLLFSWKAIEYYSDRSTKPQAKIFGKLGR